MDAHRLSLSSSSLSLRDHQSLRLAHFASLSFRRSAFCGSVGSDHRPHSTHPLFSVRRRRSPRARLASFALAYLLNPVVSREVCAFASHRDCPSAACHARGSCFFVFVIPDPGSKAPTRFRRSCATSRRKTPLGSVKHYDVIRRPSIAWRVAGSNRSCATPPK